MLTRYQFAESLGQRPPFNRVTLKKTVKKKPKDIFYNYFNLCWTENVLLDLALDLARVVL